MTSVDARELGCRGLLQVSALGMIDLLKSGSSMVDLNTRPFPSCLCFAGLQCVDGLGELPGAPGAAAELAQVLELRVRALAGRAEFRVGAVGVFLGFRLSSNNAAQ